MSDTDKPIVAKARLRNFGNGILEVDSRAIRFYTVTGRFKKRRNLGKEIQLTNVENIERQENDLKIIQKDSTDVFALEQQSQTDIVHERIVSMIKHTTNQESNKSTVEMQNPYEKPTSKTIEVTNSLFNILKSLHGRVDWTKIESEYKQFEENAKELANESIISLSLNTGSLSSAVQEHRSKETAEKTFELLETLYEYSTNLPYVKDSEQFQLNQNSAKLLIHAVYVSNDIELASIVGDEKAAEEKIEMQKIYSSIEKLLNIELKDKTIEDMVKRLHLFGK